MGPNGLIPFPAFMVVWMIYGVAGIPLYFSRNIVLKRRYFRPYIIGAAVLFLSGMLLTGFPFVMVAISVLPVAFITRMNLKRIRFCERCGSTIMRHPFFEELKFCSRCGAPLDSKTDAPAT